MIRINGENKPEAEGMSVSAYIELAGYRSETVAVELNGEILKKDNYSRVLCDGDKMEIVTFMGGGCI